MIFNFSLYNHTPGGFGTYEDIIRPLKAMLEDLGHYVTRDNVPQPSPTINVVFEGFNTVASVETLRRLRDKHYRFVVVATEMPTHKTDTSFIWNDHTITYWIERAEGFRSILPYVDAVWCLVQGTAEYLRKFHAYVSDIELGYSPRLINHETVKPSVDFCIYGSPSNHRFAVAARLREAGCSVAELYTFPFVEERNALVLSARIVLDVRMLLHLAVVSTSRIVTALHLGRPCISEPRGASSTQSKRWGEITRFSASADNFLAEAIPMLPSWREDHHAQLEALKRMRAVDMLAQAVRNIPEMTSTITSGFDPSLITHATFNGVNVSSPQLLCSYNFHNIVAYNHEYFVIPQGIGVVRLEQASERARPGVQRFATEEAAKGFLGL